MNLTCIAFGVIFFLAGFVFFIGKGHEHISAWKQMPESEKAKIHIKPLYRNVGFMIAICGVIFLAAGLSAFFKENFFIWAMILWFILSGADFFHIAKSPKYQVMEP